MDQKDPFYERVYIHILALVGLVVKNAFDKTIKRVCVEAFGDTFEGFHAADTKKYPRMVAKLLSRLDHRDESLRPRPAFNMDIVRGLVAVPLTEDIEPFLACLARATGGFIKFKNHYTDSPEELHSRAPPESVASVCSSEVGVPAVSMATGIQCC
jgi:hypothetical protein